MKLSRIALTLIVAAGVATPALRLSAADAGPYLTLDGGVNILQDVTVKQPGHANQKAEMDTGFRVGAIGGYNLNEWAAVELESGFMYNGVKHSDTWLGAVPILGNVVFRYENSSGFVPYIGVGAGGAYTMVQGGGNDQSDFVFAYQAKVGVAYKISDNMAVDLGYKFFGTAEQKYDNLKLTDIYAHYVGLSITLKF